MAHVSAEVIVPETGLYIWSWFLELSGSVNRIIQGQPMRVMPSEWLAWSTMTGRIVEPAEYAILRDMDAAFCSALSGEMAEAHARQRAADEARKPKKRGKR